MERKSTNVIAVALPELDGIVYGAKNADIVTSNPTEKEW